MLPRFLSRSLRVFYSDHRQRVLNGFFFFLTRFFNAFFSFLAAVRGGDGAAARGAVAACQCPRLVRERCSLSRITSYHGVL
jgi:hypothetical protein